MKKSLFATVMVVVAATASAEDSQIRLSYTQADFESVESVKALHRRIRALARDFCPRYARIRDLRTTVDCVNGTAQDLIDAVDHPVLTAYTAGEDEVRIAIGARNEAEGSAVDPSG